MVRTVNAIAAFRELIKGTKPVAVDFFATWCGPCRVIGPFFEELSTKFSDIEFIKVDVDQAAEIATEMGITAMPTFMFFKDGKKVTQVTGADRGQLERAVESLRK